LEKYYEQMEKVLTKKSADEVLAFESNMKTISTLRNLLDHTEIDRTHLHTLNSLNYKTAENALCKSDGVASLLVRFACTLDYCTQPKDIYFCMEWQEMLLLQRAFFSEEGPGP